jgi:hypothetical protein
MELEVKNIQNGKITDRLKTTDMGEKNEEC